MSPTTDTLFLDALACRGVLVSVSVRYWRARHRLEPGDLGLKIDQIDPRLISLGHKRLLPKEDFERIARIESQAHAFVEENTFPFLNGLARFLPNTKLETVLQRLDTLKQEFQREQARFLEQYGPLRAKALQDWRAVAESLGNDPDAFARLINGFFPPAERMPRLFAFEVRTFQVMAPDVPQAVLIDADNQRELLHAREEAALKARQEIESSCRAFIGDCVASLREQTVSLCGEMLTTIRSSGSVHQKTLNRLLRFIEQFRALNFTNDKEMEQQLEQVKQEFLGRPAEQYRDSRYFRGKLVEGLTALRETARDLSRQDATPLVESFGQLGQRRFHLAA